MGINYSKCISQANKLLGISYEYQRLYNSVMNLADNSSSYWRGDANQAFREQIVAWKSEAVAIQNEIDDLAYLIKKTSKEIRDEEMDDSGEV